MALNYKEIPSAEPEKENELVVSPPKSVELDGGNTGADDDGENCDETRAGKKGNN